MRGARGQAESTSYAPFIWGPRGMDVSCEVSGFLILEHGHRSPPINPDTRNADGVSELT